MTEIATSMMNQNSADKTLSDMDALDRENEMVAALESSMDTYSANVTVQKQIFNDENRLDAAISKIGHEFRQSAPVTMRADNTVHILKSEERRLEREYENVRYQTEELRQIANDLEQSLRIVRAGLKARA